MKNKGISLIVLIITCVTIIILATAIIVNIAQTNMIENAKEAVVKQDFKTMQDELNMYKADKYVETRGNFKAEDLDIIKKEDIAKIMPSIVGTKYEAYVLIEDGKIAISEDMPEQERIWAMEALGLVKTSTNRPTEPEQPVEPEKPTTPNGDEIVFDNTNGTANVTINGKEPTYNNPIVPVGFMAINTTDANWNDENGWNNGLVIEDKIGNQFVWVPVDGTNITYTKRFEEYPKNSSVSKELDDTKALPIVNGVTISESDQITNYGGFYIGRYEAGIAESNSPGIPTVQQGTTVWTKITYTNAYTNALAFCDTNYAKSGIITGNQWDTVMKWLENSGVDVANNSIAWGNYSNTDESAKYDIDGITKISGVLQTAGKSEKWKAKNIYDLAGNAYEMTAAHTDSAKTNKIVRGATYQSDGDSRPAAYRHTISSSSQEYIGFRIVLYVI